MSPDLDTHVVTMNGQWNEQKGGGAFGLICVLFLASRLLLLNYNEAEFTDGYDFIVWSFKFAPDFPYHDLKFRLPAYPLLIRLPAQFLDPIVSGRLISPFSGLLCLLPLYKLCVEVYGRRAALLTCILFTVSALILFLTTRVLSDSLFLFFALATVLYAFRFFSRSETDSLPWVVLFSGLASLTRPEGLVLAPLWIAGLFRAIQLRLSKTVLVSMFPFLLWLVAIWLIVPGETGYGNVMRGSFRSLDPARFFLHAWTYLKIYPYLIFYPLFIFFVYNQFREMTTERRVWLVLLLYVHLAFLTVISVHSIWTTRFLVFPMTLLLVEAAAGMDRLENHAPKWLSKGLTILCILGSVVFAMVTLHFQKEMFANFRRTGEYLRSNFQDARIFSSNRFKESYYFGKKMKAYSPDFVYQEGDVITLHFSEGSDKEEELKLLRTRYQAEILFQTDVFVIPMLANTIVTKGTNTPGVVTQRFHPQKFTGIVLRIRGPKNASGINTGKK